MKKRKTKIVIGNSDDLHDEDLDLVCKVFELLNQWDREQINNNEKCKEN